MVVTAQGVINKAWVINQWVIIGHTCASCCSDISIGYETRTILQNSQVTKMKKNVYV